MLTGVKFDNTIVHIERFKGCTNNLFAVGTWASAQTDGFMAMIDADLGIEFKPHMEWHPATREMLDDHHFKNVRRVLDISLNDYTRLWNQTFR